MAGRFRIVDDDRLEIEHLSEEVRGDERLGRPLRDDLARAHRNDVRRVAGCEVEVVQHGDERAPAGVQSRAEIEHVDLVRDVEVRCRLVEQQDRRLLGEGHREPGALPLAPTELLHEAFSVLSHLDLRERPSHRSVVRGAPLPQDALVRVSAARDEVGDGDRCRSRWRLRERADASRDLLGAEPCEVRAVERNDAARWPQHARQRP